MRNGGRGRQLEQLAWGKDNEEGLGEADKRLWGTGEGERLLEQLAWRGVEVGELGKKGVEQVVALKQAALSRALLRYEGLCLLWPCGLCGGLDVEYCCGHVASVGDTM